MKEYRILLCCGAGMSSGFLAQQMRKSAKKRGVAATVQAKNQNEVAAQLPETDILLLGPHLEYMLGDMQAECAPLGVPVRVIPKDIYGGLDGGRLLDICLEILEGEAAQ